MSLHLYISYKYNTTYTHTHTHLFKAQKILYKLVPAVTAIKHHSSNWHLGVAQTLLPVVQWPKECLQGNKTHSLRPVPKTNTVYYSRNNNNKCNTHTHTHTQTDPINSQSQHTKKSQDGKYFRHWMKSRRSNFSWETTLSSTPLSLEPFSSYAWFIWNGVEGGGCLKKTNLRSKSRSMYLKLNYYYSEKHICHSSFCLDWETKKSMWNTPTK